MENHATCKGPTHILSQYKGQPRTEVLTRSIHKVRPQIKNSHSPPSPPPISHNPGLKGEYDTAQF